MGVGSHPFNNRIQIGKITRSVLVEELQPQGNIICIPGNPSRITGFVPISQSL
jgi:hypothetical protein